MFPDTVPSPIGFLETAQLLEQKFRDCRVISKSISSNLSSPKFLQILFNLFIEPAKSISIYSPDLRKIWQKNKVNEVAAKKAV
jgi:hypothetical protein